MHLYQLNQIIIFYLKFQHIMIMCTKLCQRNWPVAVRYLPGQFSLGFSYSNIKNAAHQAIIASQWIETIKSHQYSGKNLTLNQFIKSDILKEQIEKKYKQAKKKNSSEPSDADLKKFSLNYENLRRQFFIEGKLINMNIFSQTRLSDGSQDIRNAKIVFFLTQFSTQDIFQQFTQYQIETAKKQYVYYGTAGISKTFSFVLLVLLTNYVNYFRYKDQSLGKQYDEIISLPRKKFIYGSVQKLFIGKIQEQRLKTNNTLKEQFHEMSEKLKNINDYEEIKSTIKRQFEQKNIEIIPIIDQTNTLLSLKREFVKNFEKTYKHKDRQLVLESIYFKQFLFSYQYFVKYRDFGNKFILNNSEMCQFSLLSSLNSKNEEFVKDFNKRMEMVHIGGHDQLDIFTSPFKNRTPTTQKQIFEFFLFQIKKCLKIHEIQNKYLQKTLNLKGEEEKQNDQQDKQLQVLEKKFTDQRNFHFNETFLQIRKYVRQRFSKLNIQATKIQIKQDSKKWFQNFILSYRNKLSQDFKQSLQKYWKQGTTKEYGEKLLLHFDITSKAKVLLKYQNYISEKKKKQNDENTRKNQDNFKEDQLKKNAQNAHKDYYNRQENKSVYQLLNEGIYNRTIFRFDLTDRHNNQRTKIIPIFTPQQYLDYVRKEQQSFILKILQSSNPKQHLKFYFDLIYQGKAGVGFEDLFRDSFKQCFILRFKVKDQNFEFIPSKIYKFEQFGKYESTNHSKYQLHLHQNYYKEQSNQNSKEQSKQQSKQQPFFKEIQQKNGKCIGYYPVNKDKNKENRTNPGFDFLFLNYLKEDTIEWNTIDFTTTQGSLSGKITSYKNWMKHILSKTQFEEIAQDYLVLKNRNIKIKFIHFIIGTKNSTKKMQTIQFVKKEKKIFVKAYQIQLRDIDSSQFKNNSISQLFLKYLAEYIQEKELEEKEKELDKKKKKKNK